MANGFEMDAVFGEALQQAQGNSGRSSSQNGERKSAEIWLNPGLPFSYKHPTTGEVVNEHVGLPYGLALDTMNPAPLLRAEATSVEQAIWHARNKMRNKLLAQMIAIGKKLEPGEDTALPATFTLRIQRARPKADASGNTTYDDLFSGFGDIFGG